MYPESHSSAGQATRQSSRFRNALGVLEDAIGAHAFPGCAFGVLVDGRIVLQGALGRFTWEEDSPLVAADTVYDVASLTKVVATTAAAMLLVQRGQLDLEIRLGDLLPDFVAGRAAWDLARNVTLSHLLAHSSGLPGYVELFRAASKPAELLDACQRLPIEAAPGTRAEYSDPGFILLGKSIEALVHEDLAGWMRREIYAPLGMTVTGFCPPLATRPAIPPTEVDSDFRHRCIQGEVQDENAWVLGGVAGHAGLFSNVQDLLRLAAAILGDRRSQEPRKEPSLFDRRIVEQFAQRQLPQGSARALGWDTPSEPSSSGKHFSRHSIGHLGYSGCSLWIDLDAGLAVVLLSNRTWPDRKSQLIRQVRPAFHDAVREAI